MKNKVGLVGIFLFLSSNLLFSSKDINPDNPGWVMNDSNPKLYKIINYVN